MILPCSVSKADDTTSFALLIQNDEEWVVLVFYQDGPDYKQYHGISFTSQRFRGHSDQWPRRDMLLWQHQQCVQKHFRGYSHEMTADDERARATA